MLSPPTRDPARGTPSFERTCRAVVRVTTAGAGRAGWWGRQRMSGFHRWMRSGTMGQCTVAIKSSGKGAVWRLRRWRSVGRGASRGRKGGHASRRLGMHGVSLYVALRDLSTSETIEQAWHLHNGYIEQYPFPSLKACLGSLRTLCAGLPAGTSTGCAGRRKGSKRTLWSDSTQTFPLVGLTAASYAHSPCSLPKRPSHSSPPTSYPAQQPGPAPPLAPPAGDAHR